MIITDDVYCTFVDNFKSVISDLPYNNTGVYKDGDLEFHLQI